MKGDVSIPFNMIFTIVLLVALVIFGFYVITEWGKMQELAQIDTAVDSIRDVVDDWYYNTWPDSTKLYTIQIPGSSTFCFIDPENPQTRLAGGWESNEIIESMITENGYNLWIKYQNGASQMGKVIDHMYVSQNFCASSGEELKLENTGENVEVSLHE